MTKKMLNQNAKYDQRFLDKVEPKFEFNNKPINRLKVVEENSIQNKTAKEEKIFNLKKKINSIQDCNLKDNSKNLVMGDGDINSPIMLIGEAPNEKEDLEAKTFCGDVGVLLTKMLLAINIKKEKVYSAYSINFRPPNDRKPTAQEIKRYSIFLKEHISIIDPKILILMGTTAMEAVTGLSNQITNERGDWKELIIGNKTIPVIITFNPSYLIRYPDKKKFSWEDLKKIRKKVEDLNIKI
ncbi:uracil-DNA glycosylase [Candidatus Pelagibacter sp.]|nr:uracil-DNA glycosylase [Candidatus Pelagibacter sp.]